jgi:hypothetical protein
MHGIAPTPELPLPYRPQHQNLALAGDIWLAGSCQHGGNGNSPETLRNSLSPSAFNLVPQRSQAGNIATRLIIRFGKKTHVECDYRRQGDKGAIL